jgi:hypothetical protein
MQSQFRLMKLLQELLDAVARDFRSVSSPTRCPVGTELLPNSVVGTALSEKNLEPFSYKL